MEEEEYELEFELTFDSEFPFEFAFVLQFEFTCALDLGKLNFGFREGHFGQLSEPRNWAPSVIWHPRAPQNDLKTTPRASKTLPKRSRELEMSSKTSKTIPKHVTNISAMIIKRLMIKSAGSIWIIFCKKFR